MNRLVIFHVLTIFPEFFAGPFAHGVVKRAKDAGLLDIRIHNLRDWTHDRHKTVDDRPFGGEEGMVLKCEPIFSAVESIWPERSERQKVVLLSAQGRLFDQAMAKRLSANAELLLICGRYEGVDERVAANLAEEEISIGNFVLSGGELAAAVVVDTVARLIPGFWATRHRASSNRSPPPATDRACSIARTGPVRPTSAGGRCRRCCSTAIMPRSVSSASPALAKRRRGSGRTCCRLLQSNRRHAASVLHGRKPAGPT